MVAKRRRRSFPTADEAARAALAAAPVADEDPEMFWGKDWREKLQMSLDDVAAGRVERFSNDEGMLAALERLHDECRPMNGQRDSGATSNP